MHGFRTTKFHHLLLKKDWGNIFLIVKLPILKIRLIILFFIFKKKLLFNQWVIVKKFHIQIFQEIEQKILRVCQLVRINFYEVPPLDKFDNIASKFLCIFKN